MVIISDTDNLRVIECVDDAEAAIPRALVLSEERRQSVYAVYPDGLRLSVDASLPEDEQVEAVALPGEPEDIERVMLYWDASDPYDVGWAYRIYGRTGELSESGRIDGLDTLLYALRGRELDEDSECDATGLPNFGGREPTDTSGVWSWDEDRALVGASFQQHELMIIERGEL